MKIILTTTSPSINSTLDPRFGRGAYLLIVDLDTQSWEAIVNPGVNATGGAGIQAAQYAKKIGAEAVLSGDFGPHAFEALQAAGIRMYVYGDCQTVQEALDFFRAGKLQLVSAATRSDCEGGHHGQGL